jgi:tRNA uridine 5-carboxymethylaminomethyl modification enzyme
MRGLERVALVQPGYAVEYDYLIPGQISPWFESRRHGGLFFAGQINGSSGYEEAAGQGLLAGLNAVRIARGRDPWVPRSDQSYLGVLCEDLTQRRFEEPYRLLPGRAEHRLLLREDNAALRMVPAGLSLGLIDEAAAAPVLRLGAQIEKGISQLSEPQVRWLQDPSRQVEDARAPGAPLEGMQHELAKAIFVDVRYAPYQKQREVALNRQRGEADLPLPEQMDPFVIPGLSAEARDALARARPRRVSQAAALPGMTSEAVAILVIHARRLEHLRSVSRGTSG